MLEAGRAPVVGIRHIPAARSRRELHEKLDARPILGRADCRQHRDVILIHCQDKIERRKIGMGDPSRSLTAQVDTATGSGLAGSMVRRFTDVIGVRAGGVHAYRELRRVLLQGIPEDPFRCRRAADVAHTHEQDVPILPWLSGCWRGVGAARSLGVVCDGSVHVMRVGLPRSKSWTVHHRRQGGRTHDDRRASLTDLASQPPIRSPPTSVTVRYAGKTDRICDVRTRLPNRCLLLCLMAPLPVFAHGGVVLEEDLCVINIGYLQAHFKIYLPQERGHEEFCEDIPSTGESVFVMEYLHPGLNQATIDFRVIRNVTALGRFAGPEDVAEIPDLDAATVFYHPPAVVPGVYSSVHRFDEPGEFIGVVTAMAADSGAPYLAVFPFQVGFTGFGYWPLILILAVILQLHRMYAGGGLPRWLRRLTHPGSVATALLICTSIPVSSIHAEEFSEAGGASGWTSRSGHFRVGISADLVPLTINRIHRWVVRVETGDGEPVPAADITIRGGMPEHDHGLPTRPRVTRVLGDGNYLIEGVRFHMAGRWEVILGIETESRRDEVVIPLEL